MTMAGPSAQVVITSHPSVAKPVKSANADVLRSDALSLYTILHTHKLQ